MLEHRRVDRQSYDRHPHAESDDQQHAQHGQKALLDDAFVLVDDLRKILDARVRELFGHARHHLTSVGTRREPQEVGVDQPLALQERARTRVRHESVLEHHHVAARADPRDPQLLLQDGDPIADLQTVPVGEHLVDDDLVLVDRPPAGFHAQRSRPGTLLRGSEAGDVQHDVTAVQLEPQFPGHVRDDFGDALGLAQGLCESRRQDRIRVEHVGAALLNHPGIDVHGVVEVAHLVLVGDVEPAQQDHQGDRERHPADRDRQPRSLVQEVLAREGPHVGGGARRRYLPAVPMGYGRLAPAGIASTYCALNAGDCMRHLSDRFAYAGWLRTPLPQLPDRRVLHVAEGQRCEIAGRELPLRSDMALEVRGEATDQQTETAATVRPRLRDHPHAPLGGTIDLPRLRHEPAPVRRIEQRATSVDQPARADAVEHADLAHAPRLAESGDAAESAAVHGLIGGERGQADDEADPSRRPRRPFDRPEQAGVATQAVVDGIIRIVQAQMKTVGSRLTQGLQTVFGGPQTVREELRHRALARDARDQLLEVAAHQRLAARERDDTGPRVDALANDPLPG